jgi:hypothetical protein
MLLRCSKCGSDAGFLIGTQDGKTLEVKGRLGTDRIKRTVQVTCTYCNTSWDHVPVILTDKAIDEAVAQKGADKRLVH